MDVIPSLDLLGGKVVRLYQGDFAKAVAYGDDPLGLARAFLGQGARRIHVVDLDGARGRPRRQDGLVRDLAATGLKVQVGGGIRTPEAAWGMVAAGADRVVLGTLLKDDGIVREVLAALGPSRLVGAVDIREGAVVVEGWLEKLAVEPRAFMRHLQGLGVRRFLVTDVTRDGTEFGPNVGLYRELVGEGLAILASGGVASLSDLLALKAAGVEAAVVGRAFYEGRLSLREAVRVC